MPGLCPLPVLGLQVVPSREAPLGKSPDHQLTGCSPGTHHLTACCLWEAQLVTGSEPGGAFPLGRSSSSLFLSRFYRKSKQKCKHQLFLRWLLVNAGGPGRRAVRESSRRGRGRHGHQQKCSESAAFQTNLHIGGLCRQCCALPSGGWGSSLHFCGTVTKQQNNSVLGGERRRARLIPSASGLRGVSWQKEMQIPFL